MTLYGIADMGFSDSETSSSIAGVSNSASGLKSGNMNSSRWGIKGTEDLGGGLKANFQLESGIDVANGASSGFTRKAVVGLSGNFGEVKLGRDNNPLYDVIGTGDVFGMTGIFTSNYLPIGQRVSNMVSYESPVFGGFSAKAMVGQNKTSSETTARVTTDTTSRNTSVSGKYANGPLVVAIGWGENKGAQAADTATVNSLAIVMTSADAKQDGTAISATYDFGVAKLFANYTQGEMSNGVPNEFIKAKETNLGVSVPLGAFTLLAAYGNNDVDVNFGTGAANINGKGDDFVLGATYDLSKRTALYARTGTYNKISGNLPTGTSADYKITATAFGIRHTF